MAGTFDDRLEQIRREHHARAEQIGWGNANRELYIAFARVECEHDELRDKILGMVTVIDRRGILLSPPGYKRQMPKDRVITVDGDGTVSEPVIGPIRDGGQ